MNSLPKINLERLQATIDTMAGIGAKDNGGCCRISLTDEDKLGRDQFVTWCREAGCSVHVDAFGNIFAIRAGSRLDSSVVLTGSHLDTQPNGGRLDGIYGVLAGLEVIRTLNDHNICTERAIAVVNWTNEEGARFSPGLTGSSGYAGDLDLSFARAIVAPDGARFGDELARIGYAGTFSRRALEPIAYVELHIEQGPVLEQYERTIGVVEGVQGVRWYEVELQGSDRHAGTTPMAARQDSFMALARITQSMRQEVLSIDPEIRFTVGRVSVRPGSPNTVPGFSSFSIDLRHQSAGLLDRIENVLAAKAHVIGVEEGVETIMRRTMVVPPIEFDTCIVETVAAITQSVGYPAMRMTSGAMHDACRLSKVAPTGMIFVPSRLGISHHEDEWTAPDDLAAGANVLLRTLVSLADQSVNQRGATAPEDDGNVPSQSLGR
ncbi:M20 family metallo-hydrolase [Paraburkholderia sp. CNPSo 3274]|uniref:M20 family metallo-hydrolase n=1 Tax=unclassified Paraburkholderia TaxID=2615204 RepID=UPI0020B7AE9E|nr:MULTISPECIES: M20 family metallo-hydrolase [unclassified Paraburkholderia]MCP3713439.1 M20 family metallo-hydrolase [Paraburkholderia sp. CNPSo 3274]MCP3720525.1 M20 family metallo-hydrolase [Paraburkholderia sp. CNPSo 3281]